MDVMRRRRGIVQQAELPFGYRRVEYIRNADGNAYLDTGIVLDDECKIILEMLVASSGDTNKSLFGWRRSRTYMQPYQLYLSANGSNKYIIVGKPATPNDVGTNNCFQYDQRNKFIIDMKNQTVTINGSDVPDLLTDFSRGKAFDSSGSAEYTAHLFGFNNGGSPSVSGSPALWTRLFGYKVFKAGKLMQNLIPCINQNNVCGVYDLIGNRFLSSPNGSTFDYIG